jgi:Homeodomain-like domain-containing protein
LEALMLTVEACADSVERRLAAGGLVCPVCGQVLARWGYARERVLRGWGKERRRVRPRRARCRGCQVTQVLLPVFALGRRADLAEVIGAALVARAAGAGFRSVAGRLGRPVSTVRGWLRRFCRRAEPVRVFFTVLLAHAGPDPVMPAGAADVVAAAVSAIAGAAAAVAARWPELGEVPVWQAASAASGGLLLAPGWPRADANTN